MEYAMIEKSIKRPRCRSHNLARRAKLDGFRRNAARRVKARDGRNQIELPLRRTNEKTSPKNKFLQSNTIKKATIIFPLTISLIILMAFSGCARNFPSDKLSSVEIPEKQAKQLIKKSQIQLDHFSNECIPVVDQCLEKKQEILHILDVIEDTVGKINLDASSMEMDDFLDTVNYLRDEIKNLGHFPTSIRETKDKIEDLKNQLHELKASIDEICLVAEDESERENTKFSLKKKIMSYMVQRRIGMHAKNTFGL